MVGRIVGRTTSHPARAGIVVATTSALSIRVPRAHHAGMLTRSQVARRLGKSVATVRRLEGIVLHPKTDRRGTKRFDAHEVEALRRDVDHGRRLPNGLQTRHDAMSDLIQKDLNNLRQRVGAIENALVALLEGLR